MTDNIRWGIAATGHIADRIVTGLRQLDDAQASASTRCSSPRSCWAPDDVSAHGHLGGTGVDEQVAAVLHHRRGALAVDKAAIRVDPAGTARVSGSGGWLELPAFMHAPGHLVVGRSGRPRRIDGAWHGEGLRFQAAEVHRCLREGLTESPVMPLDETLSLAGTLDAIRDRIGLAYPGE